MISVGFALARIIHGRDRRVRKEKKKMIRRFRCELIWKKNDDDDDAGTDGEVLPFGDHRPVIGDPTSTVLPTDILVRCSVRGVNSLLPRTFDVICPGSLRRFLKSETTHVLDRYK